LGSAEANLTYPEPSGNPSVQWMRAARLPGLERKLHARFDAVALTQLGIYPGGWETDDRDWLIKAFRTLCDFYAAASEAEQAVVTLIE
jgi:hypothetical protein